jgi:hypothetical protein
MAKKTRKQMEEKSDSSNEKEQSTTPYTVNMIEKITDAEYKAEQLNLSYQQTLVLYSILEKLSKKDN